MRLDYKREIDAPIYSELMDFLPERILDSHIHTALPEHISVMTEERKVSKLGFFLDVSAVFGYNPYEFAWEVRKTLFPNQSFEGFLFGYPFPETDLDANNAYLAELIQEHGVYGLYMPRPDAERDEIERALDAGFIGFKPYPDLVPDKTFAEIRVGDYIPTALWEAAHERGAIVLVHLGRPGRLYDPYDVQDMSAACRRYPKAKVIIAHIGRPYIPSMIQDGIPESYKELPNLWFDICPICESGVLEVAIREVGPGRLLFGSDSPVTYMRGRLGEWKGNRKFFSDMDFPWNVDREPPEKEARYTFFIYEQLLGLKKAAEATGLSRAGVEDILYNNAKTLASKVE
jgi:predicted TIM-barrel fold metal-dependent hydrolase